MRRICVILLSSFLAVPAAAQEDFDENIGLEDSDFQEGGSAESTTPPVSEAAPPPAQPKSRPPQPPRERDEASIDIDSPVVRAEAGDWGMFFRFGGLASLLAGNNTRDINGLMITQVGLRPFVTDDIVIPFYFGTGYRLVDDDAPGPTRADWGFDIGASFEYHFRVWRRISPFVAANLGLGLSDATGTGNTVFGIGLGPSMGVEYFIADRVSLTAQYMLLFAIDIAPDQFVAFAWSTLAGGAMNLTFYF